MSIPNSVSGYILGKIYIKLRVKSLIKFSIFTVTSIARLPSIFRIVNRCGKEGKNRFLEKDHFEKRKRSWLTLESRWSSKDNVILFLDGFFPIDIGLGHWMLRELILVNQLDSNVETGTNRCKSKISRFSQYGFYWRNRSYTFIYLRHEYFDD